MEGDILTGKKLNEAKNNTTDEAVDAILRSAQEQLNRDMSDTARLDRMKLEKELAAKKQKDQERLEKERIEKEKAAKEKEESDRLAKEKAAKEKAEKDRIEKEKAAKEKLEKDRLAREKAAKEKAEKDRIAREKAAQEKAEKDRIAKEKAAKDKEERERLAKERLQKEKIEKEAAAQEKLQQLEKKRLIKEKTEKEKFAKEWNEKEKAEKQKKALEEIEKTLSPGKTGSSQSQTGRVDIKVNDVNAHGMTNGDVKKGPQNETAQKGNNLADAEAAVTLDNVEETFIDYDLKPPIEKKLGITVGDVISGFFELIWRLFKLAVLLSIVTAIVGFFLSREMLIRGRNGNLRCLEDMKATSTVLTNKSNQDIDVKGWLRTVKREKLTMESDDGYILVARKILQKKESNKWAVILHGYNGSMEDIYDIAMHYYKEEYNILMPDLRASGESEGSFIGMGWLDRLDVINWIDVILDENPSANVVIHGVDMGADTALMLSGEPIKDNIMAIVADGAYTSAWEVLKKEYQIRHEEWPVFPLFDMVNPVAKVWGGYSLKEADAVKQVSNTHVPILLIQGGQDTYVTQDMADTLNESIASAHRLVTIPGGMHEDCRYADPNTYYNETFNFVDAHVIR